MDFNHKIFVALLFLTALISSNFARSLDQNYEPSDKTCNDAESIKLLDNLKKVEKLQSDEKVLIVLTDSDNIYEPLKNELSKKGAVFLPLHITLNSNIEDIYKNILFLESALHLKFIIHANSVETAANIFQKFVSNFRDVSDISNSVGIALTLNTDLPKIKVVAKLNEAAKKLNRSEIINFVDHYLMPNGAPIAIFNNQSSNNQNVDTFLQDIYYSSKHEDDNFKFVLDGNFQKMINCATAFVHEKVKVDVNNFVQTRLKSHFDILKHESNLTKIERQEISANIAKSYNYLLRLSELLIDVRDPRSFLDNLLSTFKYTAYEIEFTEKYFLPQNIDAIQFLYTTSDDRFASALEEWTKPLKNFKLQNPDELEQWYQKEQGGYLFSRNFETNCVSSATKMQVRGNVIKLSEIDPNGCGSKTKFIEIFAIEKVFINTDWDFVGKEMQIAIVAPVWEIVGSPRIVLNGEKAGDWPQYKARDGNKTGNKNGAHGLAGKPGGPAGSFYGVANEIINGEQLNILANGGKGGSGQQGGTGAEGEQGEIFTDKEKFDCDTFVDGFETKFHDSEIAPYSAGPSQNHYYVYGKKGKRGGTGGNGGAGGLGGNAGSVILFDLSKHEGKSFANITATPGDRGFKGVFGYAGDGGKNGNITDVVCFVTAMWWVYKVQYYRSRSSLTVLQKIEGRGDPGETGFYGTSLKMRQVPKIASVVQNFPQTINEYKLYIRPKLTKVDNKVQSFYDSLNTRQEVVKYYNTLSLVNEFAGLEFQSFDVQDRDLLVPSFTALQQRIHDYSIMANYPEENIRFFQDVITVTEDRINETLRIINKKTGYSVMTRINEGLEYVTSEIEELEKLEKMNNDIASLNNTLSSLDDLITQAKYLIGNDLQNAMKDLEDTLDQEIDTLLEEISELKKASKEKEKELIESRKQLQKMMILKGLFWVMKVGCVVVGTVNPALALVATAASASLSVLEVQLTQNNISALVAEVPKSVKSLLNASTTYLKNEEPNKEGIIEINISEMMRNASESGKSMINNMRNKLNNILKKPNSEPILANYKSYDRFDRQTIYVKEEKIITDSLELAKLSKDTTKINDCKISLDVLKYLKVNAEVLQTTSDTVTNILKDVDKVNEIDAALNETSDNLDKLYQMEEKIYIETQPMLQNVSDFINEAFNNINELNENQILIAKWKVAETIDTVKHTLENGFKEFKIPEEMQWTLTKLMSTFELISEMHENILRFQAKKSEAKFMTMLHFTKYSKVLAKDHHLTSALIKLEMAMMYNKINDIYKNWMFTFMQFSFPTGGNILEKANWKDSMTQEDINHAVDAIKSNVEEFNNIWNSEKDFDELLANRAERSFKGRCSEDERSFFVWSKESSRWAIDDILSGKETTIVAHTPSNNFNSVKFNKVGILFTSTNSETQRKLFNVMKILRVNLTHHGDSHYRFNNRTFLIETNPTVLTFNYPKQINEISLEPSLIYTKIANGHSMLSPYATWTIKLTVDKNRSFPSLQEFMGQVDLELIGAGHVFEGDQCNTECQATMMKYYKYAYDIYN